MAQSDPQYELKVTALTETSKDPPKYRAEGQALRTKFKLLRLLTKDHRGTGEPVTPDLKDSTQFGRVP